MKKGTIFARQTVANHPYSEPHREKAVLLSAIAGDGRWWEKMLTMAAAGYIKISKKGGDYMPIYIMISTLTDEGRKTLKKHPDRIEEVNREIENMGAKVLAQYAVLGQYDFINILDAPNNEAIAKISIELGSRGTIQIVTLPAIPVDEFIEKWGT
ncbi:GYD domain-containing protein [Syntrophorhabdus aromaticivorans]|nr:GYD domain-containing protein [Syntrophorhabdus aromaticivorans]